MELDDDRARADRVARRDRVLTALLTELGLADHLDEPITEPLHTVTRPDPAPATWLSDRPGW